MSDAKLPAASVVVVAWNGRGHLERLLPVLVGHSAPPAGPFEVIVVDNGSSDGTGDLVARRFPGVRLVSSPVNGGFARGVNLGAGAARGDILVLLNDDAVPSGGWLAELVAPIVAGVADIVGGKILDLGGKRLQFAEGLLTFDGHAFQRDVGLPVEEDPYHQTHRSLFACGGNLAVRREVFQALGGFDEEFFAYFEDVDLGWRANLAGHRVLLVPTAIVEHQGAGTSGRLDPFDRGFLFEVNAFQTVVKNMEEEGFRRMLPAILLTLLSRLQSLTVRLADRDGLLGEYPFSSQGYTPSAPTPGVLGRLLGARAGLLVEHPHSLSYARSVEYILTHLDAILEKRQRVQAMRKVPDAAFLSDLEMAAVPTYPGDAELFATAFFRYLLPDGVVMRTLDQIERRSIYT